MEVISKYEKNGKYDWIKARDLTGKAVSLHDLVDMEYERTHLRSTSCPKGYVAFSEISSHNFTVFSENEAMLKKDGQPYNMLVYVKTCNPVAMKKWLLEVVNPLHNEFRKFGDNNIDRGFSKCVEVPKELWPDEVEVSSKGVKL